MIEQYFLHNRFWKNLDEYFQNDPHLLALRGLKHVHPLSWWQEIDWEKPGIYLLAGGRQIGKTTSLKLLIREKLLEKSFKPENVF